MTARHERRAVAGRVLLALAGLLVAVNLAGLIWFQQVPAAGGLPGYELTPPPQRPTVKDFWREVDDRTRHPEASLPGRLAHLVSRRIVYVDSPRLRPTFAENWILWAYARARGRYTWSDPSLAARAGGGYCDQHAVLFQSLMENARIPSRIVTLSGHVINEVQQGGRWRAIDATFDVAFDSSIEELARTPEAVEQSYRTAGQTPENSRRWAAALVSLGDNRTETRIYDYIGRPYLVEAGARVAVWLVPAFMAVLGFALWRGASTVPAVSES
jgi:Transglutaminase-like superfamily